MHTSESICLFRLKEMKDNMVSLFFPAGAVFLAEFTLQVSQVQLNNASYLLLGRNSKLRNWVA